MLGARLGRKRTALNHEPCLRAAPTYPCTSRYSPVKQQVHAQESNGSTGIIMSKVKAPKSKGMPNKHLHARSTFLYQAATYLTLQTATQDEFAIDVAQDKESPPHAAPATQRHLPLALELGSDLQQVSRKGQLRLAVDLKRSMCKSCNTVLIPGRTVSQTIENPSKGGRKPWADVLVVTCLICGGKKRFPVGATKQLKKPKRVTTSTIPLSKSTSEDGRQSDTTLVAGTD